MTAAELVHVPATTVYQLIRRAGFAIVGTPVSLARHPDQLGVVAAPTDWTNFVWPIDLVDTEDQLTRGYVGETPPLRGLIPVCWDILVLGRATTYRSWCWPDELLLVNQ